VVQSWASEVLALSDNNYKCLQHISEKLLEN
jgi:hypothetical protein